MSARYFAIHLLLIVLFEIPWVSHAAELKEHTSRVFDLYAIAIEDRIQRQVAGQDAFLCMDQIRPKERAAAESGLRRGKVFFYQQGTCGADHQIKVPDGLIHHWIAAVYLRGATLPEVLATLQDYDHYKEIYAPDVPQSRLVGRNGNESRVYMRLQRDSIVTVAYNILFEVDWNKISPAKAHCRSHSIRIAEIANRGERDEHEKRVGNDRGFLWRLNSYWRLEEREGGVYLELEVIALSTEVTPVLAWFVNPLLNSIPKAYLSSCLNRTRAELKRKPVLPQGAFGAMHIRSEPRLAGSAQRKPVLLSSDDECGTLSALIHVVLSWLSPRITMRAPELGRAGTGISGMCP
jgi:hypothetical protein